MLGLGALTVATLAGLATAIGVVYKGVKIVFIVFPSIYYRLRRKKNTTTDEHLQAILEISYERVTSFCKSFAVVSKQVTGPKDKEVIAKVKKTILKKHDQYWFSSEELGIKMLDLLLPRNKRRVNDFLKYFYCFENGYKDYTQFYSLKERVRRFFWGKNTIFHYLSIPEYRSKSRAQLIDQVSLVKTIDPEWTERYVLKDVTNFSAQLPKVSEAIERAIRLGKIKESSILHLASNQLILFVHKYAEGLGDAYTVQKAAADSLDKIIGDANASSKARLHAKAQRETLNKNWVRTPVAHSLDSQGFEQLFSEMKGVFYLPLSMIPPAYRDNLNSYMHDVIIKGAKKYVLACSKNADVLPEVRAMLKALPPDLNYIILFQVFRVSEFNLLASHRSLAYSSAKLAANLYTNFLVQDSQVSSIYVTDILQNIDIADLLVSESDSSIFLSKHLPELRTILWDSHGIELSKPSELLRLTDADTRAICVKLLGRRKTPKSHFLQRVLADKIQFYRDIRAELDTYKASNIATKKKAVTKKQAL